jgi:endoglucanase
MNRRTFLQRAAAASLLPSAFALHAAESLPTARKLPRWRGFNLLEKFIRRDGGNPPFEEKDLAWMEEWGFDFARLPMSYLCWADSKDWLKIQEREIEHIDRIIEAGRKHSVHINLNFHRAPGYCVNPPAEPLSLWDDASALEACSFHWAYFARRYKGIPNDRLSFDLLNEPPDIAEKKYEPVVRTLVAAIRQEDPGRLIVADGLRYGRDPVHSVAGLGIAQSTRGYEPFQLTHWKAGWVRGSDAWPEPEYPATKGSQPWNKERLRQDRIEPWQTLEKKSVGIHVGEWGAFNHTPHAVVLRWMRDVLALWREAGWGWALWNLRGAFGVVDSGRKDVSYEDFQGHKLDRQMLDLLRQG